MGGGAGGWFQNEPVLISRSSSICRPYTDSHYRVQVPRIARISFLKTKQNCSSTAMNLNGILGTVSRTISFIIV